jgi:hypothetical protein
MKTQFHTINIWRKIRHLSEGTQKKYVAVPFLGSRARRLLKLNRGDTLIVRFDLGTIKSGGTNPREVLYLIRKGVAVHSVENLHAKVFVFGRTAVVGSMNISESSERSLIEAGIETTDTNIVRDAREFVLSLRGDVIEPQHAKMMIKHYKPPRIHRRRGAHPTVAKQSLLWAIPLVTVLLDPEDEKQESVAKIEAKKRLQRKRAYSLESFRWTGDPLVDQLKVGQRALMLTEEGKKTMVSPPGHVLSIRRYKYRNGHRMMVCLAIRHSLRRIEKKRFLKRLGSHGKLLKTLSSARMVRNQVLAFKIGATWPTSRGD